MVFPPRDVSFLHAFLHASRASFFLCLFLHVKGVCFLFSTLYVCSHDKPPPHSKLIQCLTSYTFLHTAY